MRNETMKKSGLLLLLAVALGCAESGAPPAGSTASVSEESGASSAAAAGSEAAELALPPETASVVRFSCPTMECEFCRASVKEAVASLPGVDKVEFDENARTVTASVKPAEFKAADAIKALEDAGFPANKVEDVSTDS
jgi:copper chaperone CopZ